MLATDLDGTFLGGSDADRTRLYDWIEANRDTIGLVFVTGRDPDSSAELCDGGVPWPDYVVGDVGTTIAEVTDGDRSSPIDRLEDDIAERWNDSGDRVRAALDGHPGLTLQPTDFRYRVSYDLRPRAFDRRAHDIVAELGLDALISDNRYFDVLPNGVSKGPSLQRLVDHLGIDAETRAGRGRHAQRSVDAGLRPARRRRRRVRSRRCSTRVADCTTSTCARAIGAAGILEAIAALRPAPAPRRRPDMSTDLVIVYHRQPYEEVEEDGKIVFKENKSPNGIVPTLKSFFGRSTTAPGSPGSWPRIPSNPGFERVVEIDDSFGNYTVSRLPLTEEQVQELLPRHLERGVLADPARLQGTLQLRPRRLADLPRGELGLRRGRRRRGREGRRRSGCTTTTSGWCRAICASCAPT